MSANTRKSSTQLYYGFYFATSNYAYDATLASRGFNDVKEKGEAERRVPRLNNE